MKRLAAIAISAVTCAVFVMSSPQTASAQGPAPGPAKVTVTVTDIADHKGAMMIALFDTEAGFDSGKAIRGSQAAVSSGTVSASFDGLAPGKYAIKLFHDVDGDGKMGSNPFGMPVEPYAFSNNAKGQFGPAKWAQASFEVTVSGAAQTISLK